MTRRISYDHLKSDGRVVRITVAICEDHLAGLGETRVLSPSSVSPSKGPATGVSVGSIGR